MRECYDHFQAARCGWHALSVAYRQTIIEIDVQELEHAGKVRSTYYMSTTVTYMDRRGGKEEEGREKGKAEKGGINMALIHS